MPDEVKEELEVKAVTEGRMLSAKDLKTKEYVPMAILSFQDFEAYKVAEDAAEAIQEDTGIFMQLVQNNLWSDTVGDKRKALLSLVDEYSKRLGTDAKTKEVTAEEEKEDHPFLLVKEANGQYRWFAIYSNNLRDDDNPPEIISAKSHRTFTDMAMKGEVPMPELWQWHIPGSRWGVADSLFYGDDGFALATGLVDPGKEVVAEAMQATKEKVLVSHGMPRPYIVRNALDPSVIDFHITKEISTLPGDRAANKLTGFSLSGFKEKGMLNFDERRSWLKNKGYTDDEIAQIETNLATKALDGEGRDNKENTPAVVAETVVAEVVETPAVQAAAVTPVAEEETEVKGLAGEMNVKELLDAISAVIKPVADQVKSLTSELATMKQTQAILSAELQVKARQMVAETPKLSMAELLASSVFGTQAIVDGRTALAKDGPVQKEVADVIPDVSGISFINGLYHTAMTQAQ